MQPIATDVARSMVCVSVCLSVCLVYWSHGLAVQTRLNQSSCYWGGGLTDVGLRNHVLDGCVDPSGRVTFDR